jgi:hypothetical protein
MIHFFLCQMRAQCDRLLGNTYADAFDMEMARLDPERGSDDVVAQDYLMAEFFAKAARGDKWVPWHTVLGTHESYLHERVYSHRNLSEADRFVLMFAFSGSRELPLFDSLFQPLLQRANAGEPPAVAELHALLHQPATALKRGGDWHQKYVKYRAAGNRLHTTCYTIHPPAGCSGEEFTFFIVDHTKRYIELGQQVWMLVDPRQQQLNRQLFNSSRMCCERTRVSDRPLRKCFWCRFISGDLTCSFLQRAAQLVTVQKQHSYSYMEGQVLSGAARRRCYSSCMPNC